MSKKVLPPAVVSTYEISATDSAGETINTRERIFRLALEYFNENGIEYVGIRELARELGLSPGNVSYYFPTKEDLVVEIGRRLSEENSRAFAAAEEELTIVSFMELFRSTFHNHYKYRCLMMSAVHVMKHFEKLAASYRNTQEKRLAALKTDIVSLKRSGHLIKTLTPTDINYLVASLSHTARYWVPEAVVNFQSEGEAAVIAHYVGLIARTLNPYATPIAQQQLRPYLAGVLRVV